MKITVLPRTHDTLLTKQKVLVILTEIKSVNKKYIYVSLYVPPLVER